MHQQIIKPFATGDLYALVVDLDFLIGLEIVPHQHFLFPANQRGPNLHRGQPVDVDMRDDFVGKIDGDVGNVFVSVQVGLPGGGNRLRSLLDQVIDDRKIMRSQIPYYVHVVLKQSQIDARGIVVVELPQGSVVQQLLDFCDRTGEQEGMVNHDLQISLRCQLDELLRLGGVAGERLLDKNVLAVQ